MAAEQIPDRRELLKNAFGAIEQLKAKVRSLESASAEPIAIIGASCRFPGGANSLGEYWSVLDEGRDVVTEIPASRWKTVGYTGALPGWHAGIIDNIDGFDPRFFGISAREATTMDPQQRMVLEVAWEAIENAGYAPDRMNGSKTGVFLGITGHDYADLLQAAGGLVDVYAATGNANNAAAGRLSFLLGLQGPSLAVDTACSSSLVAIHLACLALRAGDCRVALAGGVNALLAPGPFICFKSWGMMSSDGRCKTFDAAADGFVRGEGCGMIVLKRLSDAQADGDHIMAVIRGSAVNQDGRSSGLTVPNGPAQEEVIRQALAVGRLDPADIGYVEAHGTGTSLGDPIEAHAIAAVLGAGRNNDNPLVVGSVKTNIGHLESAAGVAGLLKVVLSLQAERIPAHLNFTKMNPDIDWGDVPVEIPVSGKAWHRGSRKRIAGVSSFGFSGTNAHVILEEAPQFDRVVPDHEHPLHILMLSGRTDQARDDLALRYAEYLAKTDSDLADICHTANAGRAQFGERVALIAETREELRVKLLSKSWIEGHAKPGNLRVAFLFTGQGSQWNGMGRELYETEPVFRAALEECAQILSSKLERPLVDVIYGDSGTLLDETQYTQPALFALGWSLAQLWKSWGIEPSIVFGHSVGEYAALTVAGVWSLEDGLEIIADRARLMQALGGGWGMTAVQGLRSQVEDVLRDIGPFVSLAAINGPDNFVLSGRMEELSTVERQLEAIGVRVKRLTVSHAFHSAQMDDVSREFARRVQSVKMNEPTVRVVSSVTGRIITATDLRDAEYWRKQVRNPVEFQAAMETIAQAGVDTFVEVGPTPTLCALGSQCIGSEAQLWAPSLRKDQDAWKQILDSLGRLYVRGASIDWNGFDRTRARERVELPTYPFQRQRYWISNPSTSAGAIDEAYITEPVAGASTESNAMDVSLSTPGGQENSATSSDIDGWFYEVAWRDLPFVDIAPTVTTWTILADGSDQIELAAAICKRMRMDGSESIVISDWSAEQLPPSASSAALSGIIDLRGLGVREQSSESHSSATKSVDSLLNLVRVLAAGPSARLWIVTRGVHSVNEATSADAIWQAPLWGIGRTLAAEHPELCGGLIDLEASSAVEDAADSLWRHVSAPGKEDQVVLRGGRRLAARLVRYEAPAQMSLKLSADATYVITGGMGGLGLEVAQWLATSGARHLLLLGRTGVPSRRDWRDLDPEHPQAAAVSVIRRLEAAGVAVHIAAVDVSDGSSLKAAIDGFTDECWPTIRGVFHTAGTLRHATLMDLRSSDLNELLRPKLGAWQLDRALDKMPLDFFVLFSSASALLSSPKLGAYAAGNCFLDALAQYRRGRGKPTLSINWGVWGEAGMASKFASADIQNLAERGMGAMQTSQALAALARLMGDAPPQVAVLPINWNKWAELYPAYMASSFLSELSYADDNGRADTATRSVASGNVVEWKRPGQLREYLSSTIGGILGFAANDINADIPISTLGIDSLTAVEVRNRILAETGVSISSVRFLQGPTITDLVMEMEPLLQATSESVTALSHQCLSAQDHVDELSDLEVDAALKALLGGDTTS